MIYQIGMAMMKINMTKSHFNLLQISILYTYGPDIVVTDIVF